MYQERKNHNQKEGVTSPPLFQHQREGCMHHEITEAIKDLLILDYTPEPSDTLDMLGADSLDLIQLIMGLEDKFDIDLTDVRPEHITTVEDVIHVVSLKLGCLDE